MNNKNLVLTIGGLDDVGFTLADATPAECGGTLKTISVAYTLQPAETCHIVLVNIDYTEIIPTPKKKITIQHQSIFYVQAVDDNYKFLESATNATTLELITELTLITIAHARPFVLKCGQDQKLGNLTIPYYQEYELIGMIRNALLAILN